jgi:hypothetical protein
MFGRTRSMNRCAMNIDHTAPYFNMSNPACRRAGARGGRIGGKTRRLQKTVHAPKKDAIIGPHEETAAEAIERIDVLCPWLRGAECSTMRRPSA